ncbi:MAG: peptide ABC transporter substrate-binding protein [Acidobacteriota bacterium]|nr:peptide ABC transporter substrate-binding protein [Acidobacteriota bacterium]
MENFRKQNYQLSVVIYALKLCIILTVFFSGACNEIEKPKPAPFYAVTAPPPKKEFRWSNGKMPKSFDPALAAAPPETDIIRAIYEGLTDTDSKNLKTIPSIAISWSASDDNKTWTFILRHDAKWSNGEQVTTKDFVRSWKRLGEMGDKVSHYKLLNNIVGMQVVEKVEPVVEESKELDFLSKQQLNQDFPQIFKQPNTNTAQTEIKPNPPNQTETGRKPDSQIKTEEKSRIEQKPLPNLPFGVEAINDFTLKVSLIQPDKDFPALVANPIFRPIYGDGKEFAGDKLNANIITNGAFRVFSVGQDGITLDRAENYWNKRQVELERVRFVPTDNAEKALEAYRKGEIDAVTNADFEPLALKLLTPYDDFERTTHSALNFYEFNQKNAPFNDRRVREALTIAIERERITDGDMNGASKPALSFLPFEDDEKIELKQDKEKARNLLTDAGFPNGENFPAVKLLINRNNMQQRIARSVAKMWKDNLNIETEITVKESNELDAMKKLEGFDMIRRGAVFPTTDETANLSAIFPPAEIAIEAKTPNVKVKANETPKFEKPIEEVNVSEQIKTKSPKDETPVNENLVKETTDDLAENETILTQAEAIFELPAIPLYFPTSYSLVKPYVLGFEINTLDAPSLKNVRIDNNWQPEKTNGES